MERSVPLLNPEQIDELNLMVSTIGRQNNKTLDDLLGQQAQIENLTLMQLYTMVVKEWGKKQKIIDNLCHFSLTMMSTVEYLWGQKNQDEDRLSNAEVVIDSLNRQLQQLGDQNEVFKSRINEAESQIDQIVGEKQTIEELYRTQSCCNFNANPQSSPRTEEKPFIRDTSFEEENSRVVEENSRILAEKVKQIEALKLAKQELQSKVSQLLEENELAKMQVELAEIAIRDAVSERSSASMISQRSSDLSYREEIYTTHSHANFLSGELECFSTLQDKGQVDKKSTLLQEMLESEVNVSQGQLSTSFAVERYDSSLTNCKESPQDTTAAESPFKKKTSKLSQCSDLFSLKESVLSNPQEAKPQIKFVRNTKTASLQCNLIQGLPKLSFDYKECAYELMSSKHQKITPSNIERGKQASKKGTHKKKQPAVKKEMFLSKSEILKPPTAKQTKSSMKQEEEEKQQEIKQAESQKVQAGSKGNKSFTNLYSFFANKFVSQRIKVK